jgi:hypothetical protein
MYYTVEETQAATQRAARTINLITESCTEFTRNINDCFALFAEYDQELRGESVARDIINFEWKSQKEFVVRLARAGYSIETYAEYCGYERVKNHRPVSGDVAFDNGVMLASNNMWISVREDNSGVYNVRQAHFLERQLPDIFRPVRR